MVGSYSMRTLDSWTDHAAVRVTVRIAFMTASGSASMYSRMNARIWRWVVTDHVQRTLRTGSGVSVS